MRGLMRQRGSYLVSSDALSLVYDLVLFHKQIIFIHFVEFLINIYRRCESFVHSF